MFEKLYIISWLFDFSRGVAIFIASLKVHPEMEQGKW